MELGLCSLSAAASGSRCRAEQSLRAQPKNSGVQKRLVLVSLKLSM